jgi:hypothetical protein
MVAMQKSVRISADSELSNALRDAATTGQPVIIETDEAIYTIEIESSSPIQAEETARHKPSPDEVALSIEGIERATGAWVGLVDAEAFKAYVRERRRTSSRPPVSL